MTFQALFLTGVVLAFGSLFVTLMYVWVSTNLHQMKRPPVAPQSIPARRPEPEPVKRAA